MLNAALANISMIWPEKKEECLTKMAKLIDIMLSDEMKRYDAVEWGEDPITSLPGNKSHVTYLSILAWSIEMYMLAGGDNRYSELLMRVCEAMNRRMLRHKELNLKSFPDKPIFLPDMLVAVAALKLYSSVYNDNKYQATVDRWLELAKEKWLHPSTGLLVPMLYGNRKTSVRGCYTALNNYWLTFIDDDFARDQYLRMKKHLQSRNMYGGVKEYLRLCPKFKFDMDAGPIVNGISPSGTAFGIGCVTYFQDWEWRRGMLQLGELAGKTVFENNSRHYKLGEFASVGEATVLAMRTHLPNMYK